MALYISMPPSENMGARWSLQVFLQANLMVDPIKKRSHIPLRLPCRLCSSGVKRDAREFAQDEHSKLRRT